MASRVPTSASIEKLTVIFVLVDKSHASSFFHQTSKLPIFYATIAALHDLCASQQ
jgi:hypothetical protein